MTAPALTRRLTLERRVVEPDGGGGVVDRWEALGEVWAEVLPGGAVERFFGGAEASSVSHRIRMRWLPFGAPGRPMASQRLRDGARVYDIAGVTEADARNAFLLIWAREGAA